MILYVCGQHSFFKKTYLKIIHKLKQCANYFVVVVLVFYLTRLEGTSSQQQQQH